MLEQIVKMFTEYNIALDQFEHLQQNGFISADADIGALAYESCVRSVTPEITLAFKAVMELVIDSQIRPTLKGNLKEECTNLINQAAEEALAEGRRMSSEYFKNR